MPKIIVLILAWALVFGSPAALAHKGKDKSGDDSGFEVKIENKVDEDEDEEEQVLGQQVLPNSPIPQNSTPNSQNSTRNSQKPQNSKSSHSSQVKIELKQNEFEIEGIISSVGTNSFVAAGQTVKIDPSKVGKFEQKGTLAVGKRVKVEGVIIDGMLFAEEIKVSGLVNAVVFQPTPTPLLEPQSTTSASLNFTATPSAGPVFNLQTAVSGTAVQVVTILAAIVEVLKNLVGL